MNSSVFRSLPRFDDGESGFDLLQDNTLSGDAAEVVSEAVEETMLEAAEVDPETHWRDEVHAAMRDALLSFDQSVRTIPQEMEKQAHASVLALVQDMFPRLADLFLAEEIARHLPDLLPSSKTDIQIKASPDIARELEEITLLNDFPTSDYKIVPVSSFGLGQVEISWVSGGFSYDFSERLERSIEQLKQLTAKSED